MLSVEGEAGRMWNRDWDIGGSIRGWWCEGWINSWGRIGGWKWMVEVRQVCQFKGRSIN